MAETIANRRVGPFRVRVRRHAVGHYDIEAAVRGYDTGKLKWITTATAVTWSGASVYFTALVNTLRSGMGLMDVRGRQP